MQVVNGRYGPYICVGKKNVKIPKGKDPASVTLAECLEWAKDVPEKKAKAGAKPAAKTGGFRKKKA